MLRAGVVAVVAGVMLATLTACDQSTAADPDHPHARLIVHEESHPHRWSTLREIRLHRPAPFWIEACQQAAEANHHVICPVSD